MNTYYEKEFEEVQKKLNEFYKIKFIDEEDEFEVNRSNKNRIKEIIISASEDEALVKVEKQLIITRLLHLLAKNTGCAEDSEIAECILDDLFYKRKIIHQKDIDDYYNYTSANRWD